MKIFKQPEPIYFIRLQIKKQGQESKYITLVDTTIKDVEKFCVNLIKKNTKKFDPFGSTLKLSIHIREAHGSKNGKSKSVSFFGFNTQDVYDLIIKELE